MTHMINYQKGCILVQFHCPVVVEEVVPNFLQMDSCLEQHWNKWAMLQMDWVVVVGHYHHRTKDEVAQMHWA